MKTKANRSALVGAAVAVAVSVGIGGGYIANARRASEKTSTEPSGSRCKPDPSKPGPISTVGRCYNAILKGKAAPATRLRVHTVYGPDGKAKSVQFPDFEPRLAEAESCMRERFMTFDVKPQGRVTEGNLTMQLNEGFNLKYVN